MTKVLMLMWFNTSARAMQETTAHGLSKLHRCIQLTFMTGNHAFSNVLLYLPYI